VFSLFIFGLQMVFSSYLSQSLNLGCAQKAAGENKQEKEKSPSSQNLSESFGGAWENFACLFKPRRGMNKNKAGGESERERERETEIEPFSTQECLFPKSLLTKTFAVATKSFYSCTNISMGNCLFIARGSKFFFLLYAGENSETHSQK